ncbi:MAG: hypothetical protein ACJAUU_000225, partial [Rickettsiales bacterium]
MGHLFFINKKSVILKMSEIIESENYSQLLKDLKEVIENSKKQAEDVLRNQLNFTYWQVGKRIEEEKIGGDFNYQSMVIKNLSLDLQIDVSTIRRSLQFFKNYPDNPPPKNNLSWSHYKFLLAINDVDLRQELEERAINEGWKAPRLGEEIKNLKNSTPVTESSKINRP